MSSDLALTGLASGFDWKPVVEQLVELEAIPKRRLEREKVKNTEKMSELGLLKGQLDTLKSASTVLQNDDLFEARKISIDQDSAKVLSATAAPGTMTGTFKVEVVSLASYTSMSSRTRKPSGLGGALDKNLPLAQLPLQTAITKGTFTIEGKSFNITDLSTTTLQDLIDQVNFDPESDDTKIQLEYEDDATSPSYDKIVIDSNVLSASGIPYIPVLGSPTDTSNFLKVMRLLDRDPDPPRLADFESGTSVSLWNTIAQAAAPAAGVKPLHGKWKSWLRPDDLGEWPGPTDDRLFVGYDPIDTAGQSNPLLYRRKQDFATEEVEFDGGWNKHGDAGYVTGNTVYANGYLWEATADLPSTAYDPTGTTVPPVAQNATVRVTGPDHQQGYYKLAVDLTAVDTGAGFADVVNHKPTTVNEYKKGDIVKAGDGNSYLKALRDRDDDADDFQTVTNINAGVDGFVDLKDAGKAKATPTWKDTGIQKHSQNVFRPEIIQVKGKLYKANLTSGNDYFGSNGGFIDHLGVGDTTVGKYDDNDLVVGKAGTAVEKKVFRAKGPSGWDDMNTHRGALVEDKNDWAPGDYVQNATDGKFYEASAQWPIPLISTSPPTQYAVGDYVRANRSGVKFFWKAIGPGKWNDVGVHDNGKADVPSWAINKIVHNKGVDDKFYKAKGQFSAIPAHAAATLWKQFDPSGTPTHVTNQAELIERVVNDGSNNFYGGGANWATTRTHAGGSPVKTFFDSGDFAKIGTDFYQSLLDFKNPATLQYDNAKSKINHAGGAIVEKGGSYFRVKTGLLGNKVAEHETAGGSLLYSEVLNKSKDTRALDKSGAAGTVWKATQALQDLIAHVTTTKYSASDVVGDGSSFKEAIGPAKWNDVQDHNKGADPAFASGVIVHNVGGGDQKFYEAQGNFAGIGNFSANTDYTLGGTFAKTIRSSGGAGFYTPKHNVYGNSTNLANAYSADEIVKDSGKFYHFMEDYLGDWTAPVWPKSVGNGAADKTLVRGSDGKFYRNDSGGELLNDPADPLNVADWGTGHASLALAAANFGAGVIQEYATVDPASAAALWNDVANAVTLNVPAGTTYWQDVTADVAPGGSKGFWQAAGVDPLALPAANNLYWTQDADAATPAVGDVWEDVTNLAKLQDTTGTAGVGNGLWKTVTADATNLNNAGWWTDVTSKIDLSNAANSTDYWDEITELTDKSHANFENWWTNVTAELTDPNDGAFGTWWNDVTAELTDLSKVGSDAHTNKFWTDVTAEVTDSANGEFSKFWTEYGQANSWTDFDDTYWQKVEPGMARLLGDSTESGVNPADSDASIAKGPEDYGYRVNLAQDLSLWHRVGNIHSFRGGASGTNKDDAKIGDHDDFEHPLRPEDAIADWDAAAYYETGDVVKLGGKYYRARDYGPQDKVRNSLNLNVNKKPDSVVWPAPATLASHDGDNPYWQSQMNDKMGTQPGETDYQPWPGASYWDLLYDPADHGGSAPPNDDYVYKMSYVDTDFWKQIPTPAPIAKTMAENPTDPYWELVQETTISSSQSLGSVNLQAKIKDANFADFNINMFTIDGNASGAVEKGVFFIGEGPGAVRIEYDVENDTVADLIERVNASDANVTLFYDPVGDRFVLQSDIAGSIGVVVHESPGHDSSESWPQSNGISRRPYEWDNLSANVGKGNILEMMGLATEFWGGTHGSGSESYKGHEATFPKFSSSDSYSKGDLARVQIGLQSRWTYWRANEKITSTDDPSVDNKQWQQVIPGVGRTMHHELGANAKIRINDSTEEIQDPATQAWSTVPSYVYANQPVFDADSHGYKGLTIDVSSAAVSDVGTFTVQRDIAPAKGAIGKFVEEFNDAQDYVRSLVAVNNEGDSVTAGTFSSNIEISRLGSQLRKIVFGDSYAHSKSSISDDGSDITIDTNTNAVNSGTSDVDQLGTDLGTALVHDYVVKVNNDNGGGTAYYRWDKPGAPAGTWVVHDPKFSSFRLADIGLDFGTGSDRMQIKNSAKLTEQLLENPEKVQALFSEDAVETTKTATADDITNYSPDKLLNDDPNKPDTGNAAGAGDLIANPLAFDNNKDTYRAYQGITHSLNDFLSNFLSGDQESGYKGAYKAHIDSLNSQNKRIDDRIEDMNRYLEQREKALSQSFIRMEEMQSKLNTQMQTLTNSFANKK